MSKHNREKDTIHKWCWEDWISVGRRLKLDPYLLSTCTKISSRWIKDLSFRLKLRSFRREVREYSSSIPLKLSFKFLHQSNVHHYGLFIHRSHYVLFGFVPFLPLLFVMSPTHSSPPAFISHFISLVSSPYPPRCPIKISSLVS